MTNDEKARRFERALALAGNTHSVADVMDKVRANRAQCWSAGDSVIITEILVYPRVKACNYWLLGGRLQECLDLQADIDAWALSEGCSVATAIGRMGWLAVTKIPLGTAWKPRGVQFVKELKVMGGGGGGQNTNTVQNSSAFIPDWLTGYTQSAVQRASDLSNQAYNPYTGQTVASQDPAQQQAYNQIGAMQGMGAGGFNSAINANQSMANQVTPISTGGINANTNALQQNFQNQVYNPAQGLLGNFAGQGPTTAQGVGQNAQALMSPYTQNVIDPALQAGQQQLALAKQGISQQANNVGAFGGSRMGVQEGVADAQTALGTQQQIGNMLNQGYGQALTAGQNIGLQAGQQGYNANTALANLLSGGYGANQTMGGNIMQQNLSQGLNAAQQLPQALAGQQQQMLGQTNALNQAGSLQQQYQQNILNSQQAAFAQQQAWPYQQLQTLLGAVSGIPYSTSSQGQFSENIPYYSNPFGQAIGGAAALGGVLGGTGSLFNSGGNSTTNNNAQTSWGSG